MFRPLLIASAASLTLAACASPDDGTAPGMPAGAAGTGSAAGYVTPIARDSYVRMAAASDLYEIQSSQLATERAQNAEVRAFAQMLIEHHTMTTEQLTAAATAAGTPPASPNLTTMLSEMIAELRAADGADFDRVFLRQQVRAHEMALSVHSHYASHGDTPGLRTVAAAAVPVIRQHLERARALR